MSDEGEAAALYSKKYHDTRRELITLQDKIKEMAEGWKNTNKPPYKQFIGKDIADFAARECADELLSLLESVQDLPDSKNAP